MAHEGKKLKELMALDYRSKEEIAVAMGTTRNTVYKWCNYPRLQPDFLEKIAKAGYDVSVITGKQPSVLTPGVSAEQINQLMVEVKRLTELVQVFTIEHRDIQTRINQFTIDQKETRDMVKVFEGKLSMLKTR